MTELDEDDVPTLAQLNARGRKKALRRFLAMAPAVLAMLAIWLLLGRFLGWGYSLIGGVLAGAGIFIVLEKRLAAADD